MKTSQRTICAFHMSIHGNIVSIHECIYFDLTAKRNVTLRGLEMEIFNYLASGTYYFLKVRQKRVPCMSHYMYALAYLVLRINIDRIIHQSVLYVGFTHDLKHSMRLRTLSQV